MAVTKYFTLVHYLELNELVKAYASTQKLCYEAPAMRANLKTIVFIHYILAGGDGFVEVPVAVITAGLKASATISGLVSLKNIV